GAGIERQGPFRRAAVKDESQLDRQGERVPLGIGHLKAGQRAGVARDEMVAAGDVLKAQSAGVAGAENFSRVGFEHVAMCEREREAAEFAASSFGGRPGETPQRGKGIRFSGKTR